MTVNRAPKSKTRRALSAAFLAAGVMTIGIMVRERPAEAQNASSAVLAPLSDPSQAEVDALVKKLGLNQSAKAVKDLVPGWTKPKMMLVHIDRPDRLAWLQKAVPGVKLIGVYQKGTRVQNEAEAMPYAADADAFIYALPNILCDENLIQAARKLKWIHYYGAGVDDCIAASPAVADGKFLFTNSQKLRGRWVAENAFAMMVTLMRGMDVMVRMDVGKKLVQPHWGERGWQMEGRTLLVVGLGGVGTELAKMAHGIGMKVIATRANSHEGPDYVDYVGLSGELPALIGNADVVAMTAPLTPETKNMFNAAMFARMKRGAIFVNISREDVVVPFDLIAALKSGQLGAAGMNANGATANSSAPGERPALADRDPLWSAPNMLYITHNAAPVTPAEGFDTDAETAWLISREEMRRYAAGDKMLSVVDVQRGY